MRALVQAQADKAHRQHNQHRLDQHADKLVHRGRHRLGLVLHVNQLDASRKRPGKACRELFKCLAQRDDVATLGHGDPQRNHFLALVVHLHSRRINIAAPDDGNVAQQQLAARGAGAGAVASAAYRHGAQLLQRFKLPRHTHQHHIQWRLHRACRFDRILLAQLRQHLVQVQSQLRQAFLRDFDEDFFVLHTKQLYLADVGNAQQLLAHVVGEGLEFGVIEAIGLHGVNHAIHVAKVIVEKRPLHARRQRAAHVADLLAHRIPDIGHFARPG